MSAPEDPDMVDCEHRNQWGYQPLNSPVTRPSAVVTAGAPQSQTRIEQNTTNDMSVNKALPWVVLAAAFGFLGFGGMIGFALGKPWESEGRAIRAEVRAEFADRLAKQDAAVEVAQYEASIAKNTVQKLEAKLNVR